VAVKGDEVAIRDSKSPDRTVLIFPLDSWRDFVHWIVEDADELRPHLE
jgi:hypothetical protein